MNRSELVQKLANLHCDAMQERDQCEEGSDSYNRFDTMMGELEEIIDAYIERYDPDFPPESKFDDFYLSSSPGYYEYHGDELEIDEVLQGYTYYTNYYFDPIEVVFYHFKIEEIKVNESTDN